MLDGGVVYRKALFNGLRPDSQLTVSQWADAYRHLPPKAAAEPGRWRTQRTPYLREIMDALSVVDPTQVICFMKGSQVGATEAGNNWLGYIIHHAPAPVMLVMPTVELAKRASKQRIQPMIDACDELGERVRSARSRDSGNTMLSKDFDGGILIMTGANSAAGLRSMPVRYLFLDEIDAFPEDIDDEGDPISLAVKRTATFRAKRKIFLTSSPTVAGASAIEEYFSRSDKRFYFVPCPFCGGYQTLDWSHIEWDKDAQGAHLPDTAHLVCKHCDARIDEHHKVTLLERGEWRATVKSREPIRGYHLNALYSPLGWYAWCDAVRDFLSAKDNPEKLKVWKNTVLGETFEEIGEQLEAAQIKALRGPFEPFIVPRSAYILTCGVDVQKDRLYYEVRAWGRQYTSWQIDHGEIWGDVIDQSRFDRLTAMLDRGFDGVYIRLMLIDSGFERDTVYDYVREASAGRVFATKGVRTQATPTRRSKQDVTIGGKRWGLILWMIDTSYFKDWLLGRFKRASDKPGAWHLNRATTDDYCEQLTAEARIETKPGVYLWKRVRKANHYLDCAVLNVAAAHILGVHHIRPPEDTVGANPLSNDIKTLAARLL